MNTYNDSDYLKATMEENINKSKELCQNCGKQLKNEKGFAGLCEACWQEAKEKAKESNKISNENYSSNQYKQYSEENSKNKVASVIKVIAIVGAIIGLIYGFNLRENVYTEELGATIVIVSIISAVFIYGFGEIIQKLQNIEDSIKR